MRAGFALKPGRGGTHFDVFCNGGMGVGVHQLSSMVYQLSPLGKVVFLAESRIFGGKPVFVAENLIF